MKINELILIEALREIIKYKFWWWSVDYNPRKIALKALKEIGVNP